MGSNNYVLGEVSVMSFSYYLWCCWYSCNYKVCKYSRCLTLYIPRISQPIRCLKPFSIELWSLWVCHLLIAKHLECYFSVSVTYLLILLTQWKVISLYLFLGLSTSLRECKLETYQVHLFSFYLWHLWLPQSFHVYWHTGRTHMLDNRNLVECVVVAHIQITVF